MKIFFAVPAYRGLNCVPMIDALVETLKLLEKHGHEFILAYKTGSCYIQFVRNELVKEFMDTDADVLFWLDDDVSWKPEDVLKLAEMPDEIVAGIYRYKTEDEDYPVVIRSGVDNRPMVRPDGCISAVQVPTGFLCVKRTAIDKLIRAYPDRSYYRRNRGMVEEGFYDLFPQGLNNRQMVGEDFAFCRLWLEICGDIWVVPDLNLSHWLCDKGEWTEFKGNYHEFLMKQPGGINGPTLPIAKALEIPGYMRPSELLWLAAKAKERTNIVEVGSFYGRSTRALADSTTGTVLAVDDWHGPREERMSEQQRKDIFPAFVANTQDLLDSGKLTVCTSDHGEVSSLPVEWIRGNCDKRPDMVFIDGSHEYEDVRRDIIIWQRRIGKGGLLCGHDADWEGVKRAVAELIPGAQVAPNTSIWYAEVACQS